jgi:IS30 family transposase
MARQSPGSPPLPVEVRRRFWRGIHAGLIIEDAARAAGVSRMSGFRWFGEAGGVNPYPSVPTGYRLSLSEREEIAHLNSAGEGVSEIARRLGRNKATISRELRRECVGRRGYRAATAQAEADKHAKRPKQAKLATNLPLRREVQDRLRQNHSPEQIAKRLREDYPDDPEMQVSHETIYQSLYVQGRGALRRDLAKHLRTGRALRKPHRNSEERRPRIRGMVNISERPAEVEDRAVPGHWEGDLIIGKDSGSAIGTLVERMTGFVLLLHLPTDHGALAVQQAMVDKMSQLPAILRQTLTWDRGTEMANHVQIAEATDLDIYFCDPHSPWQRGSNENTNGLLRQYFPKGTDLSVHGAGYLDFVAAELNNRPRKRHNWRTPAEVLDKLLSNPSNPPGVALTG